MTVISQCGRVLVVLIVMYLLVLMQIQIRAESLAPAGTYPSHQRSFLPVLPTTLARLLLRSQAERKALRSYPTGQVRRKEKGCHYISPYPVLTCRGTADEFNFVTVGIVYVHGAAGEDGMDATARFVPCGY